MPPDIECASACPVTLPVHPGHVQVAELDRDRRWVRALDGTEYMPGLVGLNNMKANDYANAVVQVPHMPHMQDSRVSCAMKTLHLCNQSPRPPALLACSQAMCCSVAYSGFVLCVTYRALSSCL